MKRSEMLLIIAKELHYQTEEIVEHQIPTLEEYKQEWLANADRILNLFEEAGFESPPHQEQRPVWRPDDGGYETVGSIGSIWVQGWEKE